MQKLSNKALFIIILIISSTLFSFASYGQKINVAEDMKFLEKANKYKAHFHERPYIFKQENNALVKYNPVSMVFGGLLYVYQNTISQQLSANCLYHPSCSEFSKKSIAHYGLFKGIFLTSDRITRCNKIAGLDIHPLKLNSDTHKAEDPIKLYE